MKHQYKLMSQKILKSRRDLFLSLTVIFAIAIVLLIILLYKKDTKVVVIPATLSSPAVFDNNGASKSVVADMARYYADLFLNATPSNADYRAAQILKLTSPLSHEAIKNILIEQNEQLSKNKATTAFYPTEVRPDNKAMAATISGKLNVYVGSHLAESLNKTYQIQFDYKYGLLTLKSFDEVKQDD